ncbi:MAG: dihydropteroate synthase [Candidatus Latescibacteria bacterium]|nr:dihydropteroate synthase [Candidatus Latescibacterota bacterium]
MQFRLGAKVYEGDRPLVMGILNITPDSFYGGSRFPDTNSAVNTVYDMVESGADIIDIGGESSRPGAEQISEDEELSRVIPVIEAISGSISVPVSIDTYKSKVAEAALKAGASVVNDISALRFDPDMVNIIEFSGASVVLMHMQGTPGTMQKNPYYGNVIEEILDFLKKRVDFAVSKGILQDRIIVDPGIGFGKLIEHNLSILRQIKRFHETGCAILVGASRKSLIGAVTGAPVEERLWGTAAITAHCVVQGVEIHRVHDIKAIRQVCDVAAAIRG